MKFEKNEFWKFDTKLKSSTEVGVLPLKLESSTKVFDPKLERTSVSFPAILSNFGAQFQTSKKLSNLEISNASIFSTYLSNLKGATVKWLYFTYIYRINSTVKFYRSISTVGNCIILGNTNSEITGYFRCENVRDSTVFCKWLR